MTTRMKLFLLGVTLAILAGIGAATPTGNGWAFWRSTTQSSVPGSPTSSHYYHWDDTSGRERFSTPSGDLYVPACTPSSTGDVCSWDATAHQWTATAGGGGGASTSTRVRAGSPIPNGSVAANAAVYIRPFAVPSDVTRVRVRIANMQGDGTAIGSVATNVGVCASNGSLGCSGSETTHLSQTIPADGTDLVLPSTTTWDTVSPGADGRILVIYSISATNVAYVSYPANSNAWGCYATGTSTVSPVPACSATDQNPVFWIHVEYDTSKRRVAVKGDSLSIGSTGSGTAPGFDVAWPQLLARTNDIAVETEGMNGNTLANEVDLATYPDFWTWQTSTASECFVALGTNDIPSGFKAMKQNFHTLVGLWKARGCTKLYTYTVPPCSAYAANEANRLAWNDYLRGMADIPPGEITHVYDFDAALDPTHSGSLSATACGGGTCDAGDGCHWSAAAETVLVNRINSEGF
jgi:lysophospholipase L1-like esterase